MTTAQQITALRAKVTALETKVASLTATVAALEQRPATYVQTAKPTASVGVTAGWLELRP